MTARPDLGVQVAWRTERRRAARIHHPDVGGDTEDYLRAIAAIAAIDARYGLCVDPGGRPPGPTHARTTSRTDLTTTIRRTVRRWVRRSRRLTRTLPTRLPRSMPGARRYTTL
ncbi:MAG: hypothetical protein ACOH10_14155 [Rhodoglobus sp.]